MPNSYSVDLRKKILEAYLNQEGTNGELAKRFKISLSTVKRIGQRYRETGKVELYMEKCGRKAKLDSSAALIIQNAVAAQPDITLKEIQQILLAQTGISVVISSIHNALRQSNFHYKKKSAYAAQRDRDDIKKKRRLPLVHPNETDRFVDFSR